MLKTFIVAMALFVAIAAWPSVASAQFDFFGARTNAMVMEIDQCQSAFSSYKERYAQYPPCCAESDPATRGVRFMRHVQVAFTNSNYGVTKDAYDRLRNGLRANGALGTGSQPYNYRNSAGEIVPLDLDKLDAAEAIPFWLGGFPTPCDSAGKLIAPTRLFGFNADKDFPLRRDSAAQEAGDPLKFRTIPFYDFKQDRFTDVDDDGWPEYTLEKDGAPLVYFDYPTYTVSASEWKKLRSLQYPTDPKLVEKFGTAVPLLSQLNTDNAEFSRWELPSRFQLISAGSDRRYGPAIAEKTIRVVEFSTGKTYTSTDGKTFAAGELAKEEQDNLTNLSAKKLGEAVKEAKK